MGPPSPGKVLREEWNNKRLMGRGRAEGKSKGGKRLSLAVLIQGEGEVIKQFSPKEESPAPVFLPWQEAEIIS